MQPTVDLCLGTFLVISGFALSLLNLRRIIKKSAAFTIVLLSENIFLTCVGLAFASRSVYSLHTTNMNQMEIKGKLMDVMSHEIENDCNIWFVLISYGPYIVSLVNSFLALIIDNYLHYKMLSNIKDSEDQNTVQEIGTETWEFKRINVEKISLFWRRYFPLVAIALQWIIPVIMVLPMYSMRVTESKVSDIEIRSLSDSCMAVLGVTNDTCTTSSHMENITAELGKYITTNYLDDYENTLSQDNKTILRDSVVNNIYSVISRIQNKTKSYEMNVTSPHLHRKPKSNERCMKMCYIENKRLLLYMFLLGVVCFFVPVTISTMILTKIHAIDVKKPNAKTYVSRELMYNILFWTPAMFDTVLSLILCSYALNSMTTSIFNVVANVYQAIKNFMNTKYFNENSIVPV